MTVVITYAPSGNAPHLFDQETGEAHCENVEQVRDLLVKFNCSMCHDDINHSNAISDLYSTACACELWIDDPDGILDAHWG